MSTALEPALTAAERLIGLVDAIEARGWELLVGPAASGGWLASVAGTRLHHPLRASGPTAAVALDELATQLGALRLDEATDTAPPAPTETFIVRFQSDDGRMTGVTCADLTEARQLARARDGHIVRRATEVVV